MNIDKCSVCGGDIRMQCAVGTGVCSGNCEKKRDTQEKVDSDS